MIKKLYFSVECGKTYNVRAEKKIYYQGKCTIADENGKTKLDIALERM
jgi:hypothetical protein